MARAEKEMGLEAGRNTNGVETKADTVGRSHESGRLMQAATEGKTQVERADTGRREADRNAGARTGIFDWGILLSTSERLLFKYKTGYLQFSKVYMSNEDG